MPRKLNCTTVRRVGSASVWSRCCTSHISSAGSRSSFEALRTLFAEAGVGDAEIATHEGTARFPSIDAWIFTDVKGWTLADMIDDGQYARLREEAHRVLCRFVGHGGAVSFRSPAHIATAHKPA
jgi:hypothetical protein